MNAHHHVLAKALTSWGYECVVKDCPIFMHVDEFEDVAVIDSFRETEPDYAVEAILNSAPEFP